MNKICTKCKMGKPLSEFYRCKTLKDGLQSWCKVCIKAYYKTEHGKIARQRAYKKWSNTIDGHLYRCFSNINLRCSKPDRIDYKNYGGRGIENRFESSDDFLDYVVNVLQVDPRGLQVDRINNNGHYEPGNIRFVTCKVNLSNRGKR